MSCAYPLMNNLFVSLVIANNMYEYMSALEDLDINITNMKSLRRKPFEISNFNKSPHSILFAINIIFLQNNNLWSYKLNVYLHTAHPFIGRNSKIYLKFMVGRNGYTYI